MLLRNFLGNLAVGKKLTASFAILLLLLIIVSTVSIISLGEYNHRALILKQANTAEIDLLEARTHEKTFRFAETRNT